MEGDSNLRFRDKRILGIIGKIDLGSIFFLSYFEKILANNTVNRSSITF